MRRTFARMKWDTPVRRLREVLSESWGGVGTNCDRTNWDTPVRRLREYRCDVRDVILSGSWGGVELI